MKGFQCQIFIDKISTALHFATVIFTADRSIVQIGATMLS